MFPQPPSDAIERSPVRIESSVTAISWIPSEAVEGLPKIPFTMGVAHYDDPPPDVIEDLDAMREADAFREANELRAFIEVADDGSITDSGHLGRGHLGVTRVKVGPKELSVAAVALPTIQSEPEIGDGWVRFKQTAGGRTGAPAPRRVKGKPFFRINSAIAWTTLALTIKADGSSEHELVGASPFPRHWVYDRDGRLVQKSGTIDFAQWYRESHGDNTPWGNEETETFVAEAESVLERELSRSIMRSEATSKPRQLQVDDTLTEQGETDEGMFLLLDGILAVEVDGETIAEVGPGAVLGARALVEGGRRTSTLRAVTPAKVVVTSADEIEPAALEELAGAHRREES
jgi:cyclic nucleotide-binding protein